MTKDYKINIKLEVCKNDTGRLSIMAHFNTNASNVFIEKDEYFWMPTAEEYDFLNEAFELMPIDESYVSPEKTAQKLKETKEPKFMSKPTSEEELKPRIKTQPMEDWKKPAGYSPMEKKDEPAVFEVTDDDIKTDHLEKTIDKKFERPSNKPYENKHYENKPYEYEPEKKKEDDGLIVEADSRSIEAALKRHTEKDETIVEADEQTIIDKVLSQKKKGKWSRH